MLNYQSCYNCQIADTEWWRSIVSFLPVSCNWCVASPSTRSSSFPVLYCRHRFGRECESRAVGSVGRVEARKKRKIVDVLSAHCFRARRHEWRNVSFVSIAHHRQSTVCGAGCNSRRSISTSNQQIIRSSLICHQLGKIWHNFFSLRGG